MGDWSQVKRAAFLDHLAASANVAASARSVGMSERGARRLKARDAAFAAAWRAALREGYERLELLLLERAIAGGAGRGAEPSAMDRYSDGFALKLLEAHRRTAGADLPAGGDAQGARERLAAKLDEMERRRGEG